MQRKCLGCDKALKPNRRKYCSKSCDRRVNRNRKKGLQDNYQLWQAAATCELCGKSTQHRAPQAKFCSPQCRWEASSRRNVQKSHELMRTLGAPVPGDLIPCANPQCFNAAIYRSQGTRGNAYCSGKCKTYVQSNRHWLGEGPSTRIYFRPCPDCGIDVAMTSRGGSLRVCTKCRTRRNKAINARKNQARRAIGPTVLSVDELAARDGCRCHVCNRKVEMSLSGNAKWGPTIEHIVPVSRGGTNDPENLALAHRFCNTARGNRGHSQMILVA